jgi:hypothetical protein
MSKIPSVCFRSALLVSLLGIPPVASAALVSLDFESAGQFAGNFRATFNPPETATSQDGGHVSTNAISLSSGTTLSEAFIYDTTPADATVQSTFMGPVTISFDMRSAAAGASFGVYIINPGEASGVAGHRLALFNMGTGATDRFRMFTTSSITNANVGTGVYDSGATLNVVEPGSTFVRASLTYSEGANSSAVFNYTINGVSSGDINLGNNTYIPNFEIGLRLYDGVVGGATADIDNFEIVPEPSSSAMFGLVAAGALVLRRRWS